MAAISNNRWQEVLDCASPHRSHPMMGLIRLPEVAKIVLDRCRTQSIDKQDPSFWIKYNFKYLRLDGPQASESPEQDHGDDTPEDESVLTKLFDQVIKYKIESVIAEVPKPKCRNVLQVLREMIHYNRVYTTPDTPGSESIHKVEVARLREVCVPHIQPPLCSPSHSLVNLHHHHTQPNPDSWPCQWRNAGWFEHLRVWSGW
jgi:hypothetical protein